MRNTKRKTTEQFIEESRRVHGDKYDYSKVEYKNQLTEVVIICPIHGEFKQKPKLHLKGHGCRECAKLSFGKGKRSKVKDNCFRNQMSIQPQSKKSSQKHCGILRNIKTCDDFIREARKIHGDKYDYSKVEYVNNLTKVCIICHKKDKNGCEHGEFWQTPSQHIRYERGCHKCAHEYNAQSQSLKKDDFVRFAIEKWDNKYSYELMNYVDYKTKVTIVCPLHGNFEQTPIQHLRSCGCKECISENKRKQFSSNTESFIEKANGIFHGYYSYNKVNYVNNKLKVIITCQKHGDFECTPANHLKGRGCPICKAEKYVYEERLFRLLKKCFGNEEINRQQKFEWLTHNKTLDFYLPKYNIAIEHQGSQHFVSIDYMGGEEKFKRCCELDKEKYKECKENNVKLLYFSYEKYYVPTDYIDTVYVDENKFIETLNIIKNE